jgi:hypothetical protein
MVDPDLSRLGDCAVYRYASLAEAFAFCEGRVSFAPPASWPDKYEKHVGSELFSGNGPFAKVVPFVKCFSVEYSSEAMWRIYAGSCGLVRIGILIKDLLQGLESSAWPSPGKVYVGRVRYVKQRDLREVVREKMSAKKVAGQAMHALLLKRAAFSFENEIRVAFLPKHKAATREVVTIEKFPWKKAVRFLLDPYLPNWQAEELVKNFRRLGVMKVSRSQFDDAPKQAG